MGLEFTVEDPRGIDVLGVLEAHLAFTRSVTPPEGVFALDLSGLLDPAVTLFGAREDGGLLGIGALAMLREGRAELKSMHTVEASRRRGVGAFLVTGLIAEARRRGVTRLVLETGNIEAFAPARELYASCGFTPCEPFGDYVGSPTSACLALDLTGVDPPTV
jgi:putative acetyltransferase